MRWKDGVAIVVVANRNTGSDARLILNLPVDKLRHAARGEYEVTDLWDDGKAVIYSKDELTRYAYTVKRDNTPRGGLGVIEVKAVP
jgi:hypothetical protein